MITPRIRPELQATPIEDEGIAFFDVHDPRSGVTMRLYDHEWQLAYQMDGHLSFEEVATWANGMFDLHVTEATLEEYANALRDLGFLAVPETVGYISPSDPSALSGSTTPLPPPSPADSDEDLPIEVTTEEVTEEQEQVTERQTALPPREVAPARSDATERNLSTAPPSATPTATAKPDEITSTPPKQGSSKSMVGLVLVFFVIAAVVAYVMLMGTGAKVSTQVARTRSVVALYDGSAKLAGAPPKALAFGEAGKITDVVAAGTEVKAGQALATLDGYAKVEKELTDVKDRLAFYQKELDRATAKGDAGAQKTAEDKVAEKKKLVADLEARGAKLRLVAPGPGTVEKVDVTNGADVKAEVPVVEMQDNRVIAGFTLSGAALATIKVGDEATVQDLKGATAAGKIAKIEGGAVSVELAEGSTLKTGDEVRLVKSKLNNVAVIPASAVIKKDGADTVFVLAGGTAHAKKVTVADHAGGEVYVSSGLQAGDQVVTSGGETLQDGDKATAGE